MAKKTDSASSVVITANRLRDGRVVWFDSTGAWVERIADAAVFTGAAAEDAVARAKDWERRQIVVEAYPVVVEADGVGSRPATMRERVRARGPSVREDLRSAPHAAP